MFRRGFFFILVFVVRGDFRRGRLISSSVASFGCFKHRYFELGGGKQLRVVLLLYYLKWKARGPVGIEVL